MLYIVIYKEFQLDILGNKITCSPQMTSLSLILTHHVTEYTGSFVHKYDTTFDVNCIFTYALSIQICMSTGSNKCEFRKHN